MSAHDTPATPVRPTDRVSDLLARHPRLVETLAARHPQLARLHDPELRRMMARLVTVEQVAGITGEPVASLVAALNAALGIVAPADAGGAPGPTDPAPPTVAPSTDGAVARAWSPADEIELDVRDDLRHGREPFSRIMGAVAALAPHQVLHLRTTFEPVPLYAVLGRRGLAHVARAHAADDWSVWFHRADAPSVDAPRVDASSRPAAAVPPAAPDEVVLDVRGLTPPEPLRRTLDALDALAPGATLVQLNDRVPQFLLPLLHERGFAFTLDTSHDGVVRVRIRRDA